MAYDIIGDIHGHSEKLTHLLSKLGYRHHSNAWRHPDRSAIFVGDFIDRGPGQLETIGIVRGMLDAGTAQAVMGNHEFNAIAWHTPDPECEGDYLRRHNANKRKQTAKFLEVVAAASRRGSMEHGAIETLLKGIEIDLPAGHEFHDKGGHRRRVSHHRVQTRWWDAAANTYRKAARLDESAREALPDTPIPSSALLVYDGDKPVFFGHYWWTGIPGPLAPQVACVDYSAGMDGPLVAYRWEGEAALEARGFVSA